MTSGPAALRRLHPLSPLLRGWKFALAVLVVVVPQNLEALPGRGAGIGAGRLLLLVLGLLGMAAVLGVVSWRFTGYGIDGGDLRIDRGVLFRKSRRVRLDRLQAVDVVQPLLGRALGLAELRLEVVGGGGEAEAPLAYLSLPDATRLRAELLARAAGIAEDTPEAPERELHAVPTDRLVWSRLLTTPVVVGVVLVPVALVGSVLTAGLGAIALLPALASIGTPLVQQLLTNYGFTLAESPDGLRIRRGLLETRAQTVPPGRIQAVRLVRPWLWRRWTDWVTVEVDIAGYGQGQDTGSAVLLPVAPWRVAQDVLHRLLPGADLTGPLTAPDAAVPARARWLAPLTRRVLAAGADSRYFVSRRGLLRREIDVLPHERAQSVRLSQGPVQRLLRLATVTLDTTPGPVTVRAEHRDAADALTLVRREVELARHARSVTAPDRWLVPRPDGGQPPATETSSNTSTVVASGAQNDRTLPQ